MEAPQTGDGPVFPYVSKPNFPGKPSELPEATGCSKGLRQGRTYPLVTLPLGGHMFAQNSFPSYTRPRG